MRLDDDFMEAYCQYRYGISTDEFIAYWRKANDENTDEMDMMDCANLTHETQVGIYGWCSCEDNEGKANPYSDCPPHGEPRYA